MNILDPKFDANEAQLRYLDGDFMVLKPGGFVRCAITGKPITIHDLKYWNVDRQEAYLDVDAAYEAYLRSDEK